MMSSIIFQFTLSELIALFGLAQSVYILVYMMLRPTLLWRAGIPILFFCNLLFIFLLSVASSRWSSFFSAYELLQWAGWALCAPLSSILVLRIVAAGKLTVFICFMLLSMVPIAYFSAFLFGADELAIEDWLHVNSIILGTISLLIIWSQRHALDDLRRHKQGRERFYLILCLILLNVGLLTMSFLQVNLWVSVFEAQIIRLILGISFLYVASTTLFRIFPQADISLKQAKEGTIQLSAEELKVATQIEGLLYLEKVYQEPAYGRSDMAKELSISESYLSRVVNLYFEKGVPQLLNEFRVEEAKILLNETEEDVTTIAREAGFNSIATFNRLFKDMVGITPSKYRQKT